MFVNARRAVAVLLATLCLGATATPGWAQRPLNVIVPFGPGGGVDQIARTYAELVKPYFKQRWEILNRAGGGGTVGLAELMRAKPDGNTIIFSTPGFLLQPYISDVPWKGAEDFQLVAIAADSPTVHFVRSDSPWKSLADLIGYSKQNPGKIKYGVTGAKGTGTVRYLQLREVTGIDWTLVPFTGDAEVVAATLGGHVETATVGVAAVTGQVKAGAIRLIAVPEDERLPAFPDVPTFKELGYNVSQPNYMIVLAPKGTPAARIEELSEAIRKASAGEAFKKFAVETGTLPTVLFGADAQRAVEQLAVTFRDFAPKMGR